MSVIRWKSFAAGRADSLCGTCIWGTVRKGYRSGDVEVFCRLVSPHRLVPFAVRECTDYADRRVPCAPDDSKSTDRSFGFVTTLLVTGGQERDEREKNRTPRPAGSLSNE